MGGTTLTRERLAPLAAAGALAVAAGVGAVVAIRLATDSPDAVAALLDVARAVAAALVLFAVCGYAPARVLCPEAMRRHEALLVLPVGAAVFGIALYALGLLRLPLAASLVLVLGAGLALALRTRGRRGPIRLDGGGENSRLVLLAPAAIALLVALLLIAPLLRPDSFATVLGTNGDAHLATGAAELLQEAPPDAERPELPVDHMPLVWDSKYPIYYVLAGASTLSGLDPVQSFGTVIALVGAMAVLGFYLLAFYVLQAGAVGSLAAVGLVALDRVVFRLGFDPFYNNLWGLFAFPPTLLFGWIYAREPSRSTATLFALFLALATLAYPILAPFPLLFVGVAGLQVWRRKRARGESPGWVRELRLRRERRWLPAYALAGLIALGVFAAALSKLWGAFEALLPGGDLGPWSGISPGFLGLDYFLGAPKGLEAIAVLTLAAAILGVARTPRDAALPAVALMLALGVSAGYVAERGQASLFHFRALVFLGPLLVAFAGIGLHALTRDGRPGVRRLAAVAAVVVVAGTAVGAYQQVSDVFPHLGRELREIDDWGERLPPDASVRVDVKPVGAQQWAWYMLAERPVTASFALREFFPHAPIGRKADYLLTNRERRSPDALGPPLFENDRYALYRMRPGVPGRDRSSREFVDPLERPGADPVGA